MLPFPINNKPFLYRFSVSFLFLVMTLAGKEAYSQKMVKFNVDGPEFFTTDSLKYFLIETEVPKIVVRYSIFDYDDKKIDLEYLYNIIEKELIRNGFSVKDRILFEEVINRAEDITDYSEIRKKTDTELIFEIVKLDTNQDYVTDSYFTNKGIQRLLYKDGQVKVKGATLEFKLIIVESNEFAGSYVFHYVPCESGCPIRLYDYEVVFEDDFGEKLPKDVYHEVTQLQLEEFFKKATSQLINHFNQIKNNSGED